MIFLPQSPPPVESLDWPPVRILSQPPGKQPIALAEVVYISGAHNSSWLHGPDGRQWLVPYTLRRLQAQLPEASFVRLHRSYLVNRCFINGVQTHPTRQHRVYLVSGLSLPVSRGYWLRMRHQFEPDRQARVSLPTNGCLDRGHYSCSSS